MALTKRHHLPDRKSASPGGSRHSWFKTGVIVHFLWLIILPFFLAGPTWASGSPVLLFFELDSQEDAAALHDLGLEETATWFISAPFALQEPELTKSLADRGSIGLLVSEPPPMNEARARLAAARKTLAAVTARHIQTIRLHSPELETYLELAAQEGFVYDSSETDRELRQQVMPEIPISKNSMGKITLSDTSIFDQYGIADDLALELLTETYESHNRAGMPLVLLLHPQQMLPHRDALHRFLQAVRLRGGTCLSLDQLLARNNPGQEPRQTVRLEWGEEMADLDLMLATLQQAGVTDAFILTRDSAGNRYDIDDPTGYLQLCHRLHARQIRCHAWLAVTANGVMANRAPDRAMVSPLGTPSTVWVSPSHPEVQTELKKTVQDLIAHYPLDGILLDPIGYPDQDADYSTVAIQRFVDDTGSSELPLDGDGRIKPQYTSHFLAWRCRQTASLVQGVADTLKGKTTLAVTVPLAALTSERSLDRYGLDVRLFNGQIDLLAVEISQQDSNPYAELGTARLLLGNTEILAALPSGLTRRAYRAQTARLLAQDIPVHGLIHPGLQPFTLSPGASPAKQPLHSQNTTPQPEKNKPAVAESTSAPFPWAIVLASIGLLVLLALLSTRFLRASPLASPAESIPAETAGAAPDLHALEQALRHRPLAPVTVQAVQQLLNRPHAFDRNQLQLASFLEILAQQGQPLALEDIPRLKTGIPGWHKRAEALVDQGVLKGLLTMEGWQFTLSNKGSDFLKIMRSQGFTRQLALFLEHRQHEQLIILCPHCRQRNTLAWQMARYTCQACGKDMPPEQWHDILECQAGS